MFYKNHPKKQKFEKNKGNKAYFLLINGLNITSIKKNNKIFFR